MSQHLAFRAMTFAQRTTRVYYDANALDRKIIGEITNKNPLSRTASVVSHLSIGEAACNENKKGNMKDFMEIVQQLQEYIDVVSVDEATPLLNKVQKQFPRLTLSDSIHLALCLQFSCAELRTRDADLLTISPVKIDELCGANSLRKPRIR